MAILKKNSFDGGTNGSSITTANSGGTSGTALDQTGNATYTTTNAGGSRGALVAKLTASSGYVGWDISGMTGRTFWVRLWVYLTASPGANNDLIYTQQASFNAVGAVRIGTDRRVLITGASNAAVSGTTTTDPIPTGQWVRIEASITVGTTTSNGACELRVYHSADSATATETKTATGVNFGTALPIVVYYENTASPDIYADGPGLSDTGWIGPETVDASVTLSALTGSWSLPAPGISTGAGVAPATLTGSWSLHEPEVTTADGLTPVNPETLTGVWDMPAPEVQAFKNVTVDLETLVGAWQVIDPFAGVPVNPGDQITTQGQVEWNGFLLGAGTPYGMQKLDGWIYEMPGLDSGNTPQPSRHGSYPGRKLAQERIVTLTGQINVPPDQLDQVVSDLIAESAVLEDDTELPLVIRLLDVPYIGYGSITRRVIPVDPETPLGLGKLTIQWTLSDPVLVSRELFSAVIADGSSVTCTNAGNAAARPLIRVPGPAPSPAVVVHRASDDRVVEFAVDVAEGETLEIDTYYGTAMIGPSNVLSTLTSESVPVFDLVLGTGSSAVAYASADGSAPPITVLWRHAYL